MGWFAGRRRIMEVKGLDNYNSWLIISFVVYTVGIVAIGLYSSRLRKKTTDDFVLANRELGPWA